MNLQSAKIRNLQKHGSVLLFILILLFSFVLLNMAAGLMFADSTGKYDHIHTSHFRSIRTYELFDSHIEYPHCKNCTVVAFFCGITDIAHI